MRIMSLILVFGFTLQLNAQIDSERIRSTFESEPTCGTFVRRDDSRLFLGFGQYMKGAEKVRLPIPAKMRVTPLNGDPAFDLQTNDAAIDLITIDDTAYLLTYSSIEEWNLNTKKRVAEYPTYAIASPMYYKQHALGFARYGDKLVIAHGRLGISVFDVRKKRLINQFRILNEQLPLESMATGISIQGRYAYVIVDNFSLVSNGSKPPFRGILVFDAETQSLLKKLDGMDPGATSVASDHDSLIVSFGGNPIWKYDLKELNGITLPEPSLRIWKFPHGGSPTGSGFMDEKYLYTCYHFPPTPGQGGFYQKRPLSLNRQVLMID